MLNLVPTMAEDAIPSLHMIQPHLRPNPPQQARWDVQHGRCGLEHEGDAVNEILSLGVNVVLHQTQTFTI